MTKLSEKDIEHVANLAKLKISKKEIKKFKKQLSEVINYVDELNEVDTSKMEPTSQTTGLENVKRKDEVGVDGLSQEEALSGTDKIHNGYFVTKATIDKK